MSATQSTMRGSDQRTIGLRTRNDLEISESSFQGEPCWVVKDPLAMKYFRLRRPEYLLLSSLKSPATYEALTDMLQAEFPAQVVRAASIQRLVNHLHQNGLLISDAHGQAKPLLQKHNRQQGQKLLALLSSVIAIRLPGVDPEPFLNWLYPKCRWFFSIWMSLIVACVCLAAGLLVVGNFSEFHKRLPELHSFLEFDNILLMAFVLMFTKTIHELGHGLMCKHFGGECHETGLMFLVFTPAMYCDTSDSWILPNRWHRIAIGAAGMYVEVFMAAICTFIWWFTHPGWLHYFCLNLMFLSSISTLIFNINPLLRYDGYYMLSDFLEIPNLSQKSQQAMLSSLRVRLLGMKPIASNLLPQKHVGLFASYSIASFVYRWFIMIVILWGASKFLEHWGLTAIGHALIMFALVGMIGMPMIKLFKFLSQPGTSRQLNAARIALSAVALIGILAFVFFVKFPHHVTAQFVLRPQNPQQVFVTQPGNLEKLSVQYGESVAPGEVIATLRNDELEYEYQELQGTLAGLKGNLVSYQLTRNRDRTGKQNSESAGKLAETIVAVSDTEQQIAVKERQRSRLQLVANRSGVVLPAPSVLESGSASSLQRWSGTPLESRNSNAFLQEQTLFCLIVDPNEFEVSLAVHQSDVKLLVPGQSMVLLAEQNRDTLFRGKLEFVSQEELMELPRELAQTNGGPIPLDPKTGQPLLKHFEAIGTLDPTTFENKDIRLTPGFYGTAKIRVGNASIAERLSRFIKNIVNFR